MVEFQSALIKNAFFHSQCPQHYKMRRRNPQTDASFIHNLCLQGINNTQDIHKKNISSRYHSPHMASNIIKNHDFSSSELSPWHATSGYGYVASRDPSNYLPGVSPAAATTTSSNGNYAVVTRRTENWQGLEQDITNSVEEDHRYTFSAWVRVHGESVGAEVVATVRLEQNSERDYKFVGRAFALTNDWVNLVGSFKLETKPECVVIYLEGPEAGVDLLVDSVVVFPLSPSSVAATQAESSNANLFTAEDKKIIHNTHFEDDIQNWSGNGCDILSHYSLGHETILPFSGQCFASATERTASWSGIQQDITGRVQRNVAYEVTAVVRVSGRNVTSGDVEATLLLKSPDQQDQYISIAKVKASSEHWVHLQGKFLISDFPSEVFIYLEGPPPGTDILVDSLLVKCAVKLPPSPQPVIEGFADYGVNIIENSNLNDGCKGWISLGECKLRVCEGSPPIPIDFLGSHEPSSGHYICATERTETWMGPAQKITDKLKLFLTYQVSALVSVSSGVTHPQTVKITLIVETPCETSTGVDKHWEDVGQVEVGNDEWHEIRGSFRIEKQPSEVMVYIQGPSSGVDLMVDRLQIFPVDRNARFEKLKRQTDQIRKRDVILKFSGSNFSGLVAAPVRVEQTKNSFPFGSCISRKNIDKEEFVNFFIENFNWAVFENELKWYWTERKQSECDFDHADDLLAFCKKHNIDIRGHCIFWEVDDGENSSVPLWVSSLNETELKEAVKNRLTDLLPRYEGNFKHYDVNNEMLHGSFYQDRLGEDIRSYMFKKANQLDPSATLFVNDYNVEDGRDSLSSPEKYIQHIRDLQEQGAPVGGIGIQGHIKCPVGEIVCSAFDKLKVLDLPIWLTELDVSSTNEYVRADDLEVMLREAFAHPAVHGIMLWGFMELGMSRENAHLVDADGKPNAAGERYLSLKKEWLSEAKGCINSEGEFSFRGFHGAYTVEIDGYSKTFVIDNGNSKQVVTINL